MKQDIYTVKTFSEKAAWWGLLIYIFVSTTVPGEYTDNSYDNENFAITAAKSNQLMVNPVFNKIKPPKFSIAKYSNEGICLKILEAEGIKTYCQHNQLKLTPSLICYKFPLSEQTVAG